MFVLGTQWLILYAILLDNLTSVTIYTLCSWEVECKTVALSDCNFGPPSPHQFENETHNGESSRYIMLANLCVNALSIEGPYGLKSLHMGLKNAHAFEDCLDYLLTSMLPNVVGIYKIGMHPFPWGLLNLCKRISITTVTIVFFLSRKAGEKLKMGKLHSAALFIILWLWWVSLPGKNDYPLWLFRTHSMESGMTG